MNPLIVLPPKSAIGSTDFPNNDRTAAMRAAAEQEFYDVHGTPMSVLILRLMTWLKSHGRSPFTRAETPGAGWNWNPMAPKKSACNG